MPSWYRVVRAARYLKVAPWDLNHAPVRWLAYAEAAIEAEARAQKAHQERARSKGKKH